MRRLAAGRHLLPLLVPWPVAWLGVRLVQAVLPGAGLRAGSVIGLVHADPAPVFAVLDGVLRQGDLRPFSPLEDLPKRHQIS